MYLFPTTDVYFLISHKYCCCLGKTRDLFKKIRDTKGTFHAKMGTIKGRNGMDLTEAEDKLRRGGKNTQKDCTKKIFTTQIITMG